MSFIKSCIQLCQRKMKQTNPMIKLIFKPNYDTYSEGMLSCLPQAPNSFLMNSIILFLEEVHAELCYAEAEMLLACLTFVQDQSFLNLAKGGLRIRSCYQSYKEARNIFRNRNVWADDMSKSHFESGVRLGFGIFNSAISVLPSKVIKLLELVGFSGNRKCGFSELNKAIKIQNGLRTVLANFAMLLYQLYLQQNLAPSEVDYPFCHSLLETSISQYPDVISHYTE